MSRSQPSGNSVRKQRWLVQKGVVQMGSRFRAADAWEIRDAFFVFSVVAVLVGGGESLVKMIRRQ